MADQVMLDLETFGTSNEAVIVAIGAVKFSNTRDVLHIVDSFHVGVDPASCVAHGLKMDVSTILWWMDGARDEARRQLLNAERLDLGTALEGFAMWFGPDSLPVWGNGATFDNTILRSAYKAAGIACPWAFRDDRCYRTVKNLAPAVQLERRGTHHNALDDARSQTEHLHEVLRHLGVDL